MIAVISDTHLPKGEREIPVRCLELMAAAELIVHAGDFCKVAVLEQIERIGPPLIAVQGNVDEKSIRDRLPVEAAFEVGGHKVSVIHDAGARKGRLARMRRKFPGSDAVIFGHSHIPLHEAEAGFQIFNPGSPTEKRRAPAHTMGLIHPDPDGPKFELVEL